jgi:hypothetical protein
MTPEPLTALAERVVVPALQVPSAPHQVDQALGTTCPG